MTILQRIAQETKIRDERLRLETVEALRKALAQILPGHLVYGDGKGDRLPTNCQPPETIAGSLSMVAGKSIGSATNH
jgi:hypothetical protein